MRVLLLALAVTFLLAACTTETTLQDQVPDVDGEILYHPFVGAVSSDLRFAGITLGASESAVRELHGEPLADESYVFGRFRNLEFDLDADNVTDILYHVERGIVTAVLLPPEGASLWGEDFRLSKEDMYRSLGAPTQVNLLNLEQRYVYDELGYEVFTKKGVVDRIYFTFPQRDIDTAGEDAEACEGGLTPAIDPESGECFVLPNPCVVPEDWDVVDACEERANSPPQICIQVITAAVDPITGTCEEFSTPCDVPSSWEVVQTC